MTTEQMDELDAMKKVEDLHQWTKDQMAEAHAVQKEQAKQLKRIADALEKLAAQKPAYNPNTAPQKVNPYDHYPYRQPYQPWYQHPGIYNPNQWVSSKPIGVSYEHGSPHTVEVMH